MQFVMRLAREFRRADWRRMLSEMSATELGEWGDYFRMQSLVSGAIISGCRASVMCGWMRSLPR
ncbi:hypothetical protein BM817_004010 [Escherichia coli]|nr:hypothetical protein [Escherichia coli]EFI9871942.1 hypothetical protein [Escherichia coli]